MQERSENRKYQRIFLCLTTAIILFAFVHSLMPADMSTEESGKAVEILRSIFISLHLNPNNIDGHNVRKLAHYLEYLCMGISMMFCAYFSDVEKPLRYIFRVLFFGLLIPVTDETIQLNTIGRSGQITDVWLDFSGFLTGITAVILAVSAVKQLRKKRSRTK